VALSEFWKKFVAEYAADDIYWYFPKGGTADTEEFREKFRVFASFEGEDWTPDLQGKFLAALHAARLSVGQTRALTRIMKRVYENLGLCWVVSNQPIRITPAGRQYLKETGPSKVLDAHIWRYQLPNPLNDVDATKGISLFPHLVVVEMMLACDNYITNDEFVLFVVRMKRSSETAKGIERIKAWRKASIAIRTEIFDRLALTKWKTIDQNSGFPLAFHRCDLLLDRRTDQNERKMALAACVLAGAARQREINKRRQSVGERVICDQITEDPPRLRRQGALLTPYREAAGELEQLYRVDRSAPRVSVAARSSWVRHASPPSSGVARMTMRGGGKTVARMWRFATALPKCLTWTLG